MGAKDHPAGWRRAKEARRSPNRAGQCLFLRVTEIFSSAHGHPVSLKAHPDGGILDHPARSRGVPRQRRCSTRRNEFPGPLTRWALISREAHWATLRSLTSTIARESLSPLRFIRSRSSRVAVGTSSRRPATPRSLHRLPLRFPRQRRASFKTGTSAGLMKISVAPRPASACLR